jgi:hypothetical protein
MALGREMTAEAAKSNAATQKLYGNDLRELSNRGVPFEVSSRNEARQPGQELVDQIPMLLQDDDMPLVVVGGADWNGNRVDFSQAGPLVTVYTPGYEIECQTKVDEADGFATSSSMGKSILRRLHYLEIETDRRFQHSRTSGGRSHSHVSFSLD